jgi:hypothetical protein
MRNTGRPVLPAAFVVLLLPLFSASCAQFPFSALSLFGGNSSTPGVTHSLTGVATRTLAAPMLEVHAATLEALRKLGMRHETVSDSGTIRMVRAEAQSRQVEIEYQVLKPTSTQIRVTVRNGGFLYDRAAADEIIAQTERQLASSAKPSAPVQS